jgi:hypothetical protein
MAGSSTGSAAVLGLPVNLLGCLVCCSGLEGDNKLLVHHHHITLRLQELAGTAACWHITACTACNLAQYIKLQPILGLPDARKPLSASAVVLNLPCGCSRMAPETTSLSLPATESRTCSAGYAVQVYKSYRARVQKHNLCEAGIS